MRYLIMMLLVIMLALSDIITGVIKAYVTDRPRSQKLRIGGAHKAAELTIMATSIGLEIGIERLGMYYDAQDFGEIVGAFAAISVFAVIALMEVVSILENYAEINPDAAWVKVILKRIKTKEGNSDERR